MTACNRSGSTGTVCVETGAPRRDRAPIGSAHADRPRPSRRARSTFLGRVHAAAERRGRGRAVACRPPAGTAAAGVRLGHLRRRRFPSRTDDPGHPADRRGDHPGAGRASDRRRPLGRRTASGDRLLRGRRGAQHPCPARRPAGRSERRMGRAPAGPGIHQRTGQADPLAGQFLGRGRRLPGQAPALGRSGIRHPIPGRQDQGRRRLRDHPDAVLRRRTTCGSGTGWPRPASPCRCCPASCRSPRTDG